jgi:hypothetical protein
MCKHYIQSEEKLAMRGVTQLEELYNNWKLVVFPEITWLLGGLFPGDKCYTHFVDISLMHVGEGRLIIPDVPSKFYPIKKPSNAEDDEEAGLVEMREMIHKFLKSTPPEKRKNRFAHVRYTICDLPHVMDVSSAPQKTAKEEIEPARRSTMLIHAAVGIQTTERKGRDTKGRGKGKGENCVRDDDGNFFRDIFTPTKKKYLIDKINTLPLDRVT